MLLKRALWWDTALQKRVPVLSGRPGLWRNGKFYGLRSDYARNHEDHSPSLSTQEHMEHFRWAREDIPRLVAALRMPQRIITRSGCSVDGEEALQIFLKVRSNLSRTQVFFRPIVSFAKSSHAHKINNLRLNNPPISLPRPCLFAAHGVSVPAQRPSAFFLPQQRLTVRDY